MNELEHLVALKKGWIDHYRPWAFTLCLALLIVGDDDDMGNPRSKSLHHMTIKSKSSGQVKLWATENDGQYVNGIGFTTTRRLIVIDGLRQPAYLTFTNDPGNRDDQHDLIVPGEWMRFADSVIAAYQNLQTTNARMAEDVTVVALRAELLIGESGYGEAFEGKEGRN